MLDRNFYESLSRLRLRMSHRSSLNGTGAHRSTRKGSSEEFSDFREYMRGDDLRRVDWNIYARLDKLYIKQYMEEKEAKVSVLLDTSASMDYGTDSKAELAKDLTAVVSFLALNNMDRVLLYDMKDMNRPLSVGGGRNAFAKVLRWLEHIEFSGEIDMFSAIKKLHDFSSGVTVMISDFLHPDMLDDLTADLNYGKLVRYLNYCRQRPVILHTLAAEELHVTFQGALNLIDAETKSRQRLVADAKAIDSYEQELVRFTERMKKGCASGGGTYVLCDTGKDRRQLVFQDLRVIYDI